MQSPQPLAESLAHLLDRATRELAGAGFETARLDAEVLLRHVLGYDRTQLFLHLPGSVSPGVQLTYEGLILQRLSGVPIAYIVKTREFMGLTFGVSPAVLVPRPETEILVEWALKQIAERNLTRIADIGTGSGAIALSLAELIPADRDVSIVATDISEEALEMAKDNRHRIVGKERRGRVGFVEGDLATPITGPVDLLLANLPYLTPEQVDGNPDLIPEPRLALDGGADGLDLVRRLIADLPRVLAPDALAGFEIDPDQGDEVVRLLSKTFPDKTVRILPDLAGLTRHVVLEP